jgi:ABC-type phosphate transport system substrate-binding protein
MIRILLFIILLLYNANSLPIFDEIKIIINKHNEITVIDKQELILIYLLKIKYWHSGIKIQIIHYRNNHANYRFFIKYILEMNLFRYNELLARQNINITEVDTEQQMINAVSANTGAIGYVSNYNLILNYETEIKDVALGN